jgi:hypothetical protein
MNGSKPRPRQNVWLSRSCSLLPIASHLPIALKAFHRSSIWQRVSAACVFEVLRRLSHARYDAPVAVAAIAWWCRDGAGNFSDVS